ncbi:MerR family transcriptional regulator [Paenibacillus sp. DMB5]|uniref:MerR family transcriptional regulator n=1 Tax=Paenibacillus sp. DMB5 TaxID=1780103 RepID=UPI00076D32E5|nr:MerR family transcriptional regulator [Paenibacillus sp. DMB5]KUP24045.1 MerR family transcriptional regulator [Paenibacillus sp. DMB5]
MSSMFLIGEISRLFQIDIRTLRYYDEIGLFTPASVDGQTGYRYYSIEQFESLNTILYLKALNIPLKEIRQFVHNRNLDDILLLLKEQRSRTEDKIREFEQIQKKIDQRIHQIEDAANTEELYTVRLTELPERTMIMLKQSIHRSNNLEIWIRQLENSSPHRSSVFLGQVGLILSAASLLKHNFDEYDAIFLFAEPDKHISSDTNLKTLPRQSYLTIRFVGTHADAAEHYEKLLRHAEERGYVITDDALEITYIDYGLTQDASRFVTEIQIPVQKI